MWWSPRSTYTSSPSHSPKRTSTLKSLPRTALLPLEPSPEKSQQNTSRISISAGSSSATPKGGPTSENPTRPSPRSGKRPQARPEGHLLLRRNPPGREENKTIEVVERQLNALKGVVQDWSKVFSPTSQCGRSELARRHHAASGGDPRLDPRIP
uniref:Uncharacterized protein n=1 Tax=Nymphaea colorata TaxID=210225 RepID=A0A5K1HKR5_9MAGN|nr:unnamed protein product [Nymphaea colorata]